VFGGLFANAPEKYDYVLTNPPFGGKEGKDAQTDFAYKTSATQVLFLQHVVDCLKDGGRCAIVLDEGVLFRTNESAFVQTKRKLLDDCDLYCVISLPGGVFTATGAGVKTNVLLFDKGKRTQKIWYYDLSDTKVGKTRPLTIDKFEVFYELLPSRLDSERSWTVDFEDRKCIADKQSAPLKAKAKILSGKADVIRANIKEMSKSKAIDIVKISELE
jgi:type I restriction enzyme M protein